MKIETLQVHFTDTLLIFIILIHIQHMLFGSVRDLRFRGKTGGKGILLASSLWNQRNVVSVTPGAPASVMLFSHRHCPATGGALGASTSFEINFWNFASI